MAQVNFAERISLRNPYSSVLSQQSLALGLFHSSRRNSWQHKENQPASGVQKLRYQGKVHRAESNVRRFALFCNDIDANGAVLAHRRNER